MIEIRVIQPTELKSWWTFVKPGLETILKKSPEDWIVEDVYAQVFCKNALLWVFVEENRPLGFVVLVVRPETVHVWCLWSAVRDRLEEGSEVFWQAIKEANIKRVTFDTWRRGWDRVAVKYGFSPRTWVKELA